MHIDFFAKGTQKVKENFLKYRSHIIIMGLFVFLLHGAKLNSDIIGIDTEDLIHLQEGFYDGWLQSGRYGLVGLKYLLEKKWKLCDTVKCYMAASTHSITSININELTNEDLDVYMFSRMYNRNLYDTHMNTNRGTNNIYFELFTQACHPSFSGYSNNNEYVFDVPEVKNYAITRDIQKGIEDFCDLYLDLAKSNPYLLNIAASLMFFASVVRAYGSR